MGGNKTQIWEFTIHLYNAVNFREFIEAWRYAVPLCIEAEEINQHLIKFQPSQSEANMYDFNNFFLNKITDWDKHAEGFSLYK